MADRGSIADEIWGQLASDEDSTTRLNSLAKFFNQYERERQTASRLSPALPTSNANLRGYIRLLKRNCRKLKQDIRESSNPDTDDTESGTTETSPKPTDTAPKDSDGGSGSGSDARVGTAAVECASGSDVSTTRPEKEALHLALRVTFMTACVTPGRWATTGQGIFRPTWKDTETLADFITRVYPTAEPPQESQPISVGKLSVAYLERYASIQIKWTDRLSDHLTFMKGADWKSLYVFAHPAWLKTGLDTLERDDVDLGQTTEEALELGCLPPLLLRETLLTIHLLFPAGITSGSSFTSPQTILAREMAQHDLDPYFTYLFTDSHRLYRDYHAHPAEASSPTDIHGLYARFPHWGNRLHALWREADDPSPVTRLGHWAESRRNPRFAFWCVSVGICVALAFGILGAVLAALQFWLGYCAWVDDGRPMCGYKSPRLVDA